MNRLYMKDGRRKNGGWNKNEWRMRKLNIFWMEDGRRMNGG